VIINVPNAAAMPDAGSATNTSTITSRIDVRRQSILKTSRSNFAASAYVPKISEGVSEEGLVVIHSSG
jgi:hypothetical protein